MWPVPSLPGRGSSLEWFAQDSRGEELSQDHFQGRGQCPAASCRLHGRCGAGVTPLCHSSWETMEVPGGTALGPHGATSHPSRVRLWTGPPPAPGNTTGCHLSGESHAQGQRLLGARACPSFLRPTLRLSGPHRATSTAHEAVSCCVWGMRAVRHVHDINPRGGKGEEVLVGQVFI